MPLPGWIEAGRRRRGMSAQSYVRHPQDWVIIAWGLNFQNVEASVGDPAFLERLDQCRLLDGRTASRVNEEDVYKRQGYENQANARRKGVVGLHRGGRGRDTLDSLSLIHI